MKKILPIALAVMLLLCGCVNNNTPTELPTQQPTEVVTPTATVTPQATPEPMPTEFTDKNDQAEKLLAWYQSYMPFYEYLPDYDPTNFPGIKAMRFEGAMLNNARTRIFAYIGFPAGASKENPVPAVVLQHGGGGFAFPQWVQEWTKRGYAAIAICNTGYFPKSTGIINYYDGADWKHSLLPDDKDAGYKAIPDNSTTALNGGNDVTRNWLYHACASSTLAYNILASDERVKSDQIGLTGISWGGVITALSLGFDNRFAFYIPIYGCAYLGQSKTWMKNYFGDKTCEVWDATKRLDNCTKPILWLCWAEDTAFSIDTNTNSYLDTQSHSILSMRKDMGHSHDLGWIPYDSYRFADWVLGRGEKMTTCQQPTAEMGRELTLTLDMPSDAKTVSAKLYYLKGNLNYNSNSELTEKFSSVDCTVNGATLTVTVPDNAKLYYIQVFTGTGNTQYCTSTSLVTFD